MKSLSIIINNYNTTKLLEECIKNLLSIKSDLVSDLHIDIIVVDSGSTDGSFENSHDIFLDSIKIISSQNFGISHAYNLGMSQADGDYLLFLGTDAYPESGDIIKIFKFMEDNRQVGLATPKLVLRDGTMDEDCHRGESTPWSAITNFSYLNRIFPRSRVFNQYFMGYEDFDSRHEIGVCISHFMFIRAEVFKKIGKWDEDFFVYGEDLDICYRTKRAGYTIMYLGDISALHYKGVSVGRKETRDIKTAANSSKDTKKKMAGASVHAMGVFYKKHLVKLYPAPLNWLVFLGIFLLEKLRKALIIFS